jgi:NADH dehydrogenase FAD-containing subunit
MRTVFLIYVVGTVASAMLEAGQLSPARAQLAGQAPTVTAIMPVQCPILV